MQLQEAENQIITHYEVFDKRPSDQRLLVGAVEAHQRKLGRLPRLLAADAGFYSRENEQSVRRWG
jgi:transposase, IS5 family